MIPRFGGVFELGSIIHYWRFSGDKELIQTLENWPEDKPLPVIVYRKYTGDPLPKFKAPLAPAVHPGNGFDAVFVTIESPFTVDLVGENQPHHLWTPKDQELEDFQKAMKLTDKLTRWLRGDVGWTAGPKPDVALHDILESFTPKWKRKPLTPI